MSRLGGPSEIGAISFGITADPKQAIAGLESVKAEGAATAASLGRSGVEGGRKFAGGIGAGVTEAGHFLYRGRRAFHHIVLGALAVPLVAKESFEFGEKIGEAIVRGLETAQERRAEDSIKRLQEAFEKARSKRFEDVEKSLSAGHRGVFPGEIEKRAEAATEATEKITKATEALAAQREMAERRERKLATETDKAEQEALRFEIRSHYEKIVEYQKKIDELTKQRDQDQSFVNAKLREARDLTRQELESKIKAVEIDRAKAAQDVSRIDNLAVDISRIRALMEVSTRQRLPIDPGNGFVPVFGGSVGP